MTIAVVIVHGKNELEIVNYVKSNLRLNIKVFSEKKGKKSIQINSIDHVLKNHIFKNKINFTGNYEEVCVNKRKLENFKLFIIMDTDDADPQHLVKLYKSGEMFAKHWLSDYIVPIYNDTNLEDTLKAINYPYARKKIEKKEYLEVFPINKNGKDRDEIKKFNDKLSKCKNTNMDIFINYCLDNVVDHSRI